MNDLRSERQVQGIDGSFRVVVDKRANRIRFEDETEDSVTLVIEPTRGAAIPTDCPYGYPIPAPQTFGDENDECSRESHLRTL